MQAQKQYVIKPGPGGQTLEDGLEVIFDRLSGKVVINCYGVDAEIEEIEFTKFVQVQFLADDPYFASVRNKLYTYVDPTGGDLRVGTVVDVPTQYADHNAAIVRKLGNGLAHVNARNHRVVNGIYHAAPIDEKTEAPLGASPMSDLWDVATDYDLSGLNKLWAR